MDTTATRRLTPTRSVLRRHDYRMLLASAATSRAGDFLYPAALSLYVFGRLAHSAATGTEDDSRSRVLGKGRRPCA